MASKTNSKSVNIGARLDRLPNSGWHIKMWLVSAFALLVCWSNGIGGAVQAGYIYARKNNYDIAVQMDGDGQHDIAYLDKLLEPLIRGEADIAIGSRFLEKEGFQSSATRRIGINILSALIWLTTGKHIMDVTSGYRAVNKLFIKIYSEDYPMDYPEPEAIVAAIMHLGRVKEVPVQMRAREGGRALLLSKNLSII